MASFSCNSNSSKLLCGDIVEKPLPEALKYFEKKLNLDDIKLSKFELRIWGHPTGIDSLSFSLERFCLNNGKLNIIVYGFHKTDSSLSSFTIDEIRKGDFLKSEMGPYELPDNFLDSLKSAYDLTAIHPFNTSVVKKKMSDTEYFSDAGFNLFQEKNAGHCHTAYIRLPYYIDKMYDSIPEFKAYAPYKNLVKFIERSIDPIVKEKFYEGLK